MSKLSRLFLPSIVGIATYFVVNKLFPETIPNTISNINLDTNSAKDVRGGSSEVVKYRILKLIMSRIMHDRALKIALVSVFATVGIQHFQSEIEALLLDDVFKQICGKDVDGQLKVVCDIVQEHELTLHTKSIQELIVSQQISRDDKINLLKIKLDFIINGECGGKKRFLIMVIIAAIMSVCVSGVGGLALFLEALYRLFQEGKISRALYDKILKAVAKKWGKVPVEHLR